MQGVDLKKLTTMELLALHAAAAEELRRRGVTRSANSPLADYAETLACRALDLTPAAPSTKGYDAVDAKGNRIEIKARRRSPYSKPTRFSAIRDFESENFNYLLLMLFDEDYTILNAALLTRTAVNKKAFWQKHVNGWIVPLNDQTWKGVGVRNITKLLRDSQIKI